MKSEAEDGILSLQDTSTASHTGRRTRGERANDAAGWAVPVGRESTIRNALSIDFEDWFQPFSHRSVRGWDAHPSRVPRDTQRLLPLLRKHGVRCTFFILGEIAEK